MSVADKLTRLAENTQALIKKKNDLENQISDLTDDLSTLQTEHSALEAACDATSDAINTQLGTSDVIDAQDFSGKVTEVYDKGRDDEWSKFWDAFQLKGKRTDYQYMCRAGWNKNIFKPKYDLTVVNGFNMFTGYEHGEAIDLREEALGVKLDTSNATNLHNFCTWTTLVSALGTIDIRKITTDPKAVLQGASNLHTVEKFIIKDDGTQELAFANCYSLRNITIEGVIGRNANFSYCPFTLESMKSVISCLKDYSGTTSEGVYTLTLKDECKTALEEDGATSPNGNLWTEYVSDLGWVLA